MCSRDNNFSCVRWIFFHYLCQGGYVLDCLLAGLFAELHKTYWMGLIQSQWEDRERAKGEPIQFLADPGFLISRELSAAVGNLVSAILMFEQMVYATIRSSIQILLLSKHNL